MVSEVVSTSNGMSIQADLVSNIEAELLPTSSSPKEKVAPASQPPSPDGEVLSAKSVMDEDDEDDDDDISVNSKKDVTEEKRDQPQSGPFGGCISPDEFYYAGFCSQDNILPGCQGQLDQIEEQLELITVSCWRACLLLVFSNHALGLKEIDFFVCLFVFLPNSTAMSAPT